MKEFLRPGRGRTLVKICGIKNAPELRMAVDAGADAVGFVVLSPASPRNISEREAAALMKDVPRGVAGVMVTRELETWVVANAARDVQPDAVQAPFDFGEMGVQRLKQERQGLTAILAVDVDGDEAIDRAKQAAQHADFVLLDSGGGGTGKVHDWHRSKRIVDLIGAERVILAGGLTPKNVGDAIEAISPRAVDVSSGVEAKPGVKDADLVKKFIEEVRKAG